MRKRLDEIKEFLEDVDESVDLIIVNGELKPSQWSSLEKKLTINVYDRIRLILAIFEEHAERQEALLQLKLAQLQYERPYVRELIHRTKAGEHPGLMAGGEYQVADYYEMIKRETKKIRVDWPVAACMLARPDDTTICVKGQFLPPYADRHRVPNGHDASG